MSVDNETKCPLCGRLFIKEKKNQVYCSPSCRKKAEHLRAKKRGKPYPFLPRECAICGKTFMPTTPRQKTCGKQCSRIYMHRFCGKANPGAPKTGVRLSKRERLENREEYRNSLLEYGQKMTGWQMERERKNIEFSGWLFSRLRNAYPSMPSQNLYMKIKLAAGFFDKNAPKWRNLSLVRQTALIDLYVARGAKFFSIPEVIDTIRTRKFLEFKSLVLTIPFPGQDNRHTVLTCKQLETDFWQQ